MSAPKIATSTANHMNFRTIAFNKGYLLVDNYPIDFEEDYLGTVTTVNPIVMNMQLELMRYGYMLNAETMYALSKMDDDTLQDYAKDVIGYLEDAYGDGCFVTLFGDFPYTVLKMSEFEMFLHQIVHYLSGGTYSPAMPSCDDAELAMLHGSYDGRVLRDNYKVIAPISKCDFAEYFRTLLSGQQSLTDYDKKAVEYLCKNYEKLGVLSGDVFPEDIPFKETLCLVIANTVDYMPKTITDVLRYAVYLSGGDIALPALPSAVNFGWSKAYARNPRYAQYYVDAIKCARAPYNFMKFSRGQRKDILEMIEYVINHNKWDNVAADMKKYLGRWTRLGEILHPGEFVKKYPKAVEMFTLLRNSGQYIATYGGRLRAAREAKDFDMLLTIYKERPGELLRNIDNLLRNYPSETSKILDAVKVALSKSSTKMIYELLDHFFVRNDEAVRRNRSIVVKGARQAYQLPCLPEICESTLVELMNTIDSALEERFAQKEDMSGKLVYLEDSLADIALPKNMRSMNFMPGQMARGSRIKIQNNTGLLRCYCRWVDKLGQYDLDLSTQFYDEDFNYKTSISWNTYYKQADWAVFSGDVRHRRGNCAEYIDVDIKGALDAGCRYLVAVVNDFDGQGFTKKDAWGGVMEREEFGKEGEMTWAPDTITTGFRLTSVCTNIVMTIIDLKDMYMYVVDEDTFGIPVASHSRGQFAELTRRYTSSKRYLNALTLLEKNCKARNANVSVLSSEQFAQYKEKYENLRIEYKAMIKKYKELLANDEFSPKEFEDARVDFLKKSLDELEEKYKEMKNNVVMVSYDDIASDYTHLLEWMF